MTAAQNMHVGTTAGAFKKAGDEDLILMENNSADRTYAVPVSVEAVNTASDMHEPVLAAVH